jgi:hypothetical protein
MKRGGAVLLAVVVVLLAAAAGVGAWLLARPAGPQQPEISAYSHGHLTRVGPYLYCNVLDLNDCQAPQTQGELPFNGDFPVQLSAGHAVRGHHPLGRPTARAADRDSRAVADAGGRRQPTE